MHITTLTGKIITLKVAASDTVYEVKTKITKTEMFRADETFRLIYNGEMMRRNFKFTDDFMPRKDYLSMVRHSEDDDDNVSLVCHTSEDEEHDD